MHQWRVPERGGCWAHGHDSSDEEKVTITKGSEGLQQKVNKEELSVCLYWSPALRNGFLSEGFEWLGLVSIGFPAVRKASMGFPSSKELIP